MPPSPPLRLAPAEGSAHPEADAGRMLRILWRGKWILLGLPLVALGAAKAWLAAQTELFVATAQVQVDARAVDVLRSGAGEAINKPRTVLKQQQGLLESTTLLRRIAESPALQGLATFSPAELEGKTVMGRLHDDLDTSIDVDSDRLFVSFVSPHRAEAVVVVDEALRAYIDYHKEKKREEASGLAEIVRREWEGTREELERTSRAIAELQSKHALIAGTERSPLQGKLDHANAALDAAHLETQRLWAVHEDMRAASADPALFRERGLYWRAKGPIAALEQRLDDLRDARASREAELARLAQRGIGAGHARFAELRAELDALLLQEDEIVLEYAREYLRNSEVDHRRAELVEQRLAEDVRTLLAQVARQNEVLDRIKDLEITRGELRERVAGFDRRISELELQNQTGALNLDVIEYARASPRPAWPESEKTLLYAGGGGALLAFVLVLLLGHADRRVRAIEDVPELLGTSVLGVLPEVADGSDRARLARMVEGEPGSLVAEAIRSARAATGFALADGCGVVLVTSAASGEGKSVCASNLALSLARAGKRTLLIDADLRQPVQHQVYAVENATGLAGLLTSSVPLKQAVVASVAPGLDLLPAGDARGRQSELCEGAALAELLRSLRESYECVVVDSPAVLESSEARVLAALADAVVFVLRLDESRAPALERAAGILRGVGARIAGCLANGASALAGARAYTGGISYGDGPAQDSGPRAPRAVGDEDRTQGKARARGTDFLGLEEESA